MSKKETVLGMNYGGKGECGMGLYVEFNPDSSKITSTHTCIHSRRKHHFVKDIVGKIEYFCLIL